MIWQYVDVYFFWVYHETQHLERQKNHIYECSVEKASEMKLDSITVRTPVPCWSGSRWQDGTIMAIQGWDVPKLCGAPVPFSCKKITVGTFLKKKKKKKRRSLSTFLSRKPFLCVDQGIRSWLQALVPNTALIVTWWNPSSGLWGNIFKCEPTGNVEFALAVSEHGNCSVYMAVREEKRSQTLMLHRSKVSTEISKIWHILSIPVR